MVQLNEYFIFFFLGKHVLQNSMSHSSISIAQFTVFLFSKGHAFLENESRISVFLISVYLKRKELQSSKAE